MFSIEDTLLDVCEADRNKHATTPALTAYCLDFELTGMARALPMGLGLRHAHLGEGQYK